MRKRIGRQVQIQTFVGDQFARHAYVCVGIAPIAHILFESRPIRGLDGIDLDSQFVVIDGIDRKNRFCGGWIERDEILIWANQQWFSRTNLENQVRIRAELLAKNILDLAGYRDGVGGAAFGLAIDLDGITKDIGADSRDGWLNTQQVLAKSAHIERIVEADGEGRERRAVGSVGAVVFLDAQSCVGVKTKSLGFRA